MTLDEVIKHCEEVVDLCEDSVSKYDMTDALESHFACQDGECAEEHRQLAEWLKELKRLKEQESCEDCISRQAVMNALCDGCELFKNGEQTCHSKCEEYHFLATLPSARPKEKVGHWIDMDGGVSPCKCSECEAVEFKKSKFCPTCGVRMESD